MQSFLYIAVAGNSDLRVKRPGGIVRVDRMEATAHYGQYRKDLCLAKKLGTDVLLYDAP